MDEASKGGDVEKIRRQVISLAKLVFRGLGLRFTITGTQNGLALSGDFLSAAAFLGAPARLSAPHSSSPACFKASARS